MPRRRQKGTDTEKEDSFEEERPVDKTHTFGTIQINRFLEAGDLDSDDPIKYSIRSWSHVLMAQRLIPWPERKQLFERALKCLPGSYKIWHNYLTEYKDYCEERSIFCSDYADLNKLFEEALKHLPKMPRIWLLYAQTLANQNMVSKARQAYNWSFRNLPLTQHEKIWSKYAPWTFTLSNPKTAIQVIGRYLQLNPDFKQNYADYLRERGQFDLCAKVIQDIIKDDGYHSKQGKTKYDFLTDLIQILIQQPLKITSINGEQVIKKALEDHPNESATFWVKLCNYYIRLSEFQKARSTFEEALNKIDNAKDFDLVFGTYTKFQEEMLMALKDIRIQKEENVTDEDQIDLEVEERLAKLESLIERRPYMLGNINIRKEPNFIKFWLKLATLHKDSGNMEEYLATLIKATETIKPEQAENGHFCEIWMLYAEYYRELSDLKKFNQIFHKSTQINYRTVDDYVSVWTKWCESLIQLGYSPDALEIIKHVLFRRKQVGNNDLKIKNIDDILKSSVSIWSLYIDLQLAIGTFDSAKTAYKRCREHKSLNPLMLLNYINLLWQNSYFEEVFRVFEYAVGEFKWPYVNEIWISYITRFIERYSESPVGVERTRSIFERLLKEVPSNQCKIFYFLYAEFEQNFGLYSHAIEIYDRMISAVPEEQKFECYNIYIAKISHLLGVTKTRAVFDAALKNLSEGKIVLMAIKYAELERNLNEFQRARQIYTYAGQFTDPRDDYDALWKNWQQLELAEGNKDNYQLYLRVKRSVINKYNMLPPDLKKLEQNIRKGLI